ncbi:MAG TPA: hypothetical protein VG142_18360 [Trebonia sp.]|jgi:hypothetical protein|nr:hypothetical protein [Trebonia sp.]
MKDMEIDRPKLIHASDFIKLCHAFTTLRAAAEAEHIAAANALREATLAWQAADAYYHRALADIDMAIRAEARK